MISIKNLTKSYSNGVVSLDSVSLDIPKGSVTGLIGTNGAGKSTLLRILSGILREDEGEITLEGEPIFENSLIKNKISFISDEGYLLNNFTLEGMAELYASMRENFSYETFTRLCESMKLDPKRRINTYSKGMKRQGEVILALSSGTEYLFFDETFDGLDPIARENARRMIAEAVSDNNTTVILSSHNLSEIESICDSIALIDRGRLIFKKSVEEAMNDTRKYQAVFENEVSLDPLGEEFFRARQSGKLITFISGLEEEKLREKFTQLYPENHLIYLEGVTLTLEEIFSLEVEKSQLKGGRIYE
jgi:ABC-2 type transport system ATP-binding protein